MAPPTPIEIAALPCSLVAFARDAAVLDAEAVASFLGRIEGVPRKDPSWPPVKFSAAFLLGLGAALRLARWEQQGFSPHLTAGLPDAKQAVLDVIQWCNSKSVGNRDKLVRSFCVKVIEISSTRFAWEGQALLGADFLVGAPDEDTLLDALAEFVWHHRNLGGS